MTFENLFLNNKAKGQKSVINPFLAQVLLAKQKGYSFQQIADALLGEGVKVSKQSVAKFWKKHQHINMKTPSADHSKETVIETVAANSKLSTSIPKYFFTPHNGSDVE